jgi:uridine phosphorylase
MKPTPQTATGNKAQSELILNPDGSLYHLGIIPSDLANDIIVVGDPERVPQISARFAKVEVKKHSREFCVHTGWHNQSRITVLSTGIGVDNIDIVVNELTACVNIDLSTRVPLTDKRSLNIIRLGTSGTMREEIEVGSIVTSEFALGIDGVPWFYDPQFEEMESSFLDAFAQQVDWPENLASPYVAMASAILTERLAKDTVMGVTFTANGFYGPQFRELNLPVKYSSLWDQIQSFNFQQRVFTNFEMECAGLYALGSLMGHEVITLCTILANRKTGEFHSSPQMAVDGLIDLALSRLTP